MESEQTRPRRGAARNAPSAAVWEGQHTAGDLWVGGGDTPLWLTSGHVMRRRETAAGDVMLSTAQFWEPGQLQ